MTEVLSIGTWRNNAELIADVARLGYLEGTVLDATWGEGKFWTVFFPEHLTTNDRFKDADYDYDFRSFPWADGNFDNVVFDPDYKLNGTPALGEQDERYGTAENLTRDERMEKIRDGAVECYRVCRRRLLVKCMDQVEGGRKRWQTDLVTRAVEELGGRKIDRFDIGLAGRPQPGGRTQRTSRSKHSTLLVFEKPRSR
jgi:hypothetical protein